MDNTSSTLQQTSWVVLCARPEGQLLLIAAAQTAAQVLSAVESHINSSHLPLQVWHLGDPRCPVDVRCLYRDQT